MHISEIMVLKISIKFWFILSLEFVFFWGIKNREEAQNYKLLNVTLAMGFQKYRVLSDTLLGGPQGESVMAWLEIFQGVKTWIGCENWRYYVKNQHVVQRDWIKLAWTWISGNLWVWFVKKNLPKSGISRPPWGGGFNFMDRARDMIP